MIIIIIVVYGSDFVQDMWTFYYYFITCYTLIQFQHYLLAAIVVQWDLYMVVANDSRAWAPAGIFPGGGQTFEGAPQKICEGGPPYFFRQALKYAYRGGGV